MLSCRHDEEAEAEERDDLAIEVGCFGACALALGRFFSRCGVLFRRGIPSSRCAPL